MTDSGRAPSGQALAASDQAASRLAPSGFDPSRVRRNILDFYGLRTRDTWERCFISLGDAEQVARHKYNAYAEWGMPLAASCWVDEDKGNLKLFVADYADGRRLIARHGRNITITYTHTPPLEHQELVAIATEARRAETPKSSSVYEGAGRKASPNPSPESEA